MQNIQGNTITYKEYWVTAASRRIGIAVSLFFCALGAAQSAATVPHTAFFYLYISGSSACLFIFISFCVWDAWIYIKKNSQEKIILVDPVQIFEPIVSTEEKVEEPPIQSLEEKIESQNLKPPEAPRKIESPRKTKSTWGRAKQRIFNTLGLEGEQIQKRNYYHLLTPYIGVILAFLKPGASFAHLPINEKLEKLIDALSRDEDFSFVVQEKEDPTLEAIQIIYRKLFADLFSLAEESVSPMDRRGEFLKALDEIQKTEIYQRYIEGQSISEKEKRYIDLYQAIIRYAWTGISVYTHGQECVDFVLREGYPKILEGPLDNPDSMFDMRGKENSENFQKKCERLSLPDSLVHSRFVTYAHVLAADFKAIDKAESSGSKIFANFQSARGESSLYFCPLEKTNYMNSEFVCFYESAGKLFKTEWLRFATPTEQKKSVKPEILGIFWAFLDIFVQENKRIISFHHQSPKNLGTMRGESERLEEMFIIPNNSRYAKTFISIGIAMDGAWFNQTGRIFGERTWDYQAFREHFLTFFRIPTVIDEELKKSPYNVNWKQLENIGLDKKVVIKDLRAILDLLHQEVFDGGKELTREERHFFIIMAHNDIEEYFSIATEADYAYDQCKDSKDRTLLALILKKWKNLIRSGRINDIEELKRFRNFMHQTGLFIKGTPMAGGNSTPLRGRAKTLVEVFNFIENRFLEGKYQPSSTIKVGNVAWEFKDFIILKQPNQSLHPLPSEAKTEEEYFKSLEFDLNPLLPECSFNYTSFITGYLAGVEQRTAIQDTSREMVRSQFSIDGESLHADGLEDALKDRLDSKSLVAILDLAARSISPQEFFCGFPEMAETNKELIVDAYQKCRFVTLANVLGTDMERIAFFNHGIASALLEPLSQRFNNFALGFNIAQDAEKATTKPATSFRLDTINNVLVIESLFKLISSKGEFEPLYFKGSIELNFRYDSAKIGWLMPSRTPFQL